MVNELTLAEFAHVLFGTMWVGTSIYIEAVLVPIMKKAKTVGEFRHMLGIRGKTSGFQGFSAVFVLITGLIYLYLKYQPLEAMLTFSSGQLVFVSFILVLGAIISGFAFLRPTGHEDRESGMARRPQRHRPRDRADLRETA